MNETIIANYKKRLLSFGNISFFCVFGRDGLTSNKNEGDWKTPIGTFEIKKIYYRQDRIPNIKSTLECIPIEKESGWCDDVNLLEYNSFINLPFEGSHENLWREDNMYDIIVTIGHNDNPAIPGLGSAIFIHIAKENMEYTQGCLAIKKEDMLELIGKIKPNTYIEISS